MAFYGASTQYLSSAKWSAVTAWAASTAYTAGQLRRQLATPTVNNERVFVCTVAGTSGGSEPSWTVTRGGATTDNTVTWRECTGNAPMNGDATNAPTWNNFRNTNITLGHVVMNIAKTHVFICTTSGNSNNAAEPTWNTTAGNTTADGTATWTCIGTPPAAWSAPHARLQNSFATTWGEFPVYRVFVGSDHAETQASSINVGGRGDSGPRVAATPSTTNGPMYILTVNVAGSMPPVAADLTNTATITTTGSTQILINGFIGLCYGITFTQGTSGASDFIVGGTQNADQHYEQCNFRFGSGVGSAVFKQGDSNRNGRLTFQDCTIRFSSVNQACTSQTSAMWTNVTIDSGGSIPNILFINNNSSARHTIRNSDLSYCTGTIFSLQNSGWGELIDCKVNAAATLITASGPVADGGARGSAVRCAGSAQPYALQVWDVYGRLTASTTLRRQGGASDGTNSYGWTVVTGVKSLDCDGQSFESAAIGAYNTSLNTNKTITCYGIAFTVNMPTNQEVWLEVDYQGDASSDQGTRLTNRRASPLHTATAHTADTSDWDDGVTARANSTLYAVGALIKTASNAGRVFVCTTAGTTAGSEPAGYASAVDGGSVTDNTAVFRAGWRYSFALSLTSPQIKQNGPVYGTPCFAGNQSTTVGTTHGFDPVLYIT